MPFRRQVALAVTVLIVATASIALLAPAGGATTVTNAPIVVNSAADPGTGSCDVTECKLKEAITKANADAGADEIDFAIPGAGVHNIALAGELPAITDQLTIDGYSQDPSGTAHRIEISGQNAGANTDGLTVQAAKSAIRGLSLGDVHGDAVVITADNVTVAGNLIGLHADGNGYNAVNGVVVQDASGAVIGGTTPADRNVISDMDENGIVITGSTSSGNLIRGNYIGTDLSGGAGFGNGDNGILVSDASTTTIGGSASGAGNVISGNGSDEVFLNSHGIRLTGGSVADTVIKGSFIGTDVTGTQDVGNFGNGIWTDFSGVHDTTIGGTTAAARNLISGNDEGIVLFSAAGTVVQGNYIGTTADGMSALPNRVGIGVEGAGVLIGGPGGGRGNVISGNAGRGLDFQSLHGVIQGNLIGTTADGTHVLGNGAEGINDGGSPGVLIGGTVSGAGNVIAANGADGINVAGSARTTIQGNFIGTDRTGTKSLGNAFNGVDLSGATRSLVGGTTAAATNVIKHNAEAGVRVQDADGRPEPSGSGACIQTPVRLVSRVACVELQGCNSCRTRLLPCARSGFRAVR